MIRSAFLSSCHRRTHLPDHFQRLRTGHRRVSVIVPYGGGGAHFERLKVCLCSIGWQRYVDPKRVEVVVVQVTKPGDTPSDGTWGGECVVYAERDYDHFPLCWARNVGARAARGDVLAFVDADVVLDPEFLARALRHPDDLVTCWMSYLHEGHDPVTGPDDVRDLVEQGDVIRAAYGGGIVAPRHVVHAINGFDEVYDRAWGADDNDMVDRLQRYGLSWHNLTTEEHVVNLHQYHPSTLDHNDPGTVANRARYYALKTTKRNEQGWGEL